MLSGAGYPNGKTFIHGLEIFFILIEIPWDSILYSHGHHANAKFRYHVLDRRLCVVSYLQRYSEVLKKFWLPNSYIC